MKKNRHSNINSSLQWAENQVRDIGHELGAWKRDNDGSYPAACTKCGAHLVVGDLQVLDSRLSQPCPGEKPNTTEEQAKLLARAYSLILSWNNDPDSEEATKTE